MAKSIFKTQRPVECLKPWNASQGYGSAKPMSVDFFEAKRISLSRSAILYQHLFAGLIVVSLLATGCSRNKSVARVPVTSLPSVGYQGPAPEIENQSTSAPIMVETLPEPTTTAAEAQPNLPLPTQRMPPPKPTKAVVESRRAIRASVPAPVEAPPVAPARPIQLLPQFSDSDKQELSRKINEQLDSAQSLVESLNESHLTEQQKPNLAAVLDFLKKSRDAVKRGEFYQGLVLAQKANTLAASLVKMP